MFGRIFTPREFCQKTDPIEGYPIRGYHTGRFSNNTVCSVPHKVVLNTGSLLTGNHLANIYLICCPIASVVAKFLEADSTKGEARYTREDL